MKQEAIICFSRIHASELWGPKICRVAAGEGELRTWTDHHRQKGKVIMKIKLWRNQRKFRRW